MRWLLVLGAVAVALLVAAWHYDFRWPWAESAIYAGHSAPVVGSGGTCGRVADVYFARNSPGQPTYVDFGAPRPDQNFTVVIWRKDRANFKSPPESWQGKTICVTGVVTSSNGLTEITVHSPNQLRVSNN